MQKWLGLFIFTAVVTAASSVFAADAVVLSDEVKKWLVIGAAFGIASAAVGGALGQSKAVAAAMTGIARNPASKKELFTPMILGLVFIESLVIFTLLISLISITKI